MEYSDNSISHQIKVLWEAISAQLTSKKGGGDANLPI